MGVKLGLVSHLLGHLSTQTKKHAESALVAILKSLFSMERMVVAPIDFAKGSVHCYATGQLCNAGC